MTDKTDSKEREDFESALTNLCAGFGEVIDEEDLSRTPSGAYVNGSTEVAWLVWQARASLAPSGFDAADMATASAQGFRDGVASLAASAVTVITPETGNPVTALGAAITSESGAASAGIEPVAYAMFSANGNIRLWSKARIPHPDARSLYLHPSPPEGMVATDAMIEAGKKMLHNSNGRGAREKVERIFSAMIAAAQPTTSAGSGKGD